MLKLSIIIHTRNRVGPLRKCLERIFGQDYVNFDVTIYDDASDKLNIEQTLRPEFPDPRITWLRGETVLGCTPARNHALRLGTGDIIIGLDDDSYFIRKDILSEIATHFATFADHTALIPKIVEKQENGKIRLLVPFSRLDRHFNPNVSEHAQFVAYYVGPAYAIRREALQRVDYLSLKTPYAEDEVDLAYRLIRAGYQLYYRPDLTVVHDPERKREGRIMDLNAHIQNRVYLAYQYLPMPYAITYVFFWLVYYTVKSLTTKSTGIFALYKNFMFAFKNMKKDYKRAPLNQDGLDYLAAHHGRLWY